MLKGISIRPSDPKNKGSLQSWLVMVQDKNKNNKDTHPDDADDCPVTRRVLTFVPSWFIEVVVYTPCKRQRKRRMGESPCVKSLVLDGVRRHGLQ